MRTLKSRCLLSLEAGQLAVGNSIRVIFSYFGAAFMTQYDTVLSFCSPALTYRHARGNIVLSRADILAAPRTQSTQPVLPVLPGASLEDSTTGKSHDFLPLSTSYIWYKSSNGNYWYSIQGRWTGILITRREHMNFHVCHRGLQSRYGSLKSPAFAYHSPKAGILTELWA